MSGPGKGRVLLADDEADLRDAFAELLAEDGYEVVSVKNGQEAERQVAAAEFDLVLSDIMMPGMDGVALLRAVRGRDLDVPVILMTGSPRLETAIKAVEFGALRYLQKPVPAEELLREVASAVRLHRMAKLKRDALAHLGATDKLVGDRAGLEATFGRALDSLWMAYQPIVSARNGSLHAHEALLRTAERHVPHPGAFLEAAERLGRLPDLGRAIRASVAEFLGTGPQQRVFVNLHPSDLSDETLFDSGPLTRFAKTVVLEITERAPLDGIPDARERVRRLKQLGFQVAVDDLGAGYAGLTTFAALEPDVVKLDMALVRDVDKEAVKRRIVSSMTSLCHESGITVVAEGVETEAERKVLVELGCDLLQGYLIGRPAGARGIV